MGIIKRNQNYYIDYYYQGRRIMERVGPQKGLAKEALAVRKAAIAQGRYQIRKRGNVRFDVFAKVYLDYAKTNKRSWQRDEGLLKNLLPFFGNRLLSDISPFLIESYKKKRVGEVKPATVNREIALLKHMYNLAITWDRVTANPMKNVRLFREEPIPDRFLSQEEIAKVLAACTEYSRPIVLTALNTGMRLGEILGLKWDQVDLKDRVITVLHSKNGKVRKIPVSNALWEVLRGLKEKAVSEFVFVCDKTGGRPIHKFQHAWLNVLQRAGINRCRFHDLRHTFASHLVAGGVDLVTVKELLGHSDITMTSRYAHSAPESKRQAIAALEGRIGIKEEKNGSKMEANRILPIISKSASN